MQCLCVRVYAHMYMTHCWLPTYHPPSCLLHYQSPDSVETFTFTSKSLGWSNPIMFTSFPWWLVVLGMSMGLNPGSCDARKVGRGVGGFWYMLLGKLFLLNKRGDSGETPLFFPGNHTCTCAWDCRNRRGPCQEHPHTLRRANWTDGEPWTQPHEPSMSGQQKTCLCFQQAFPAARQYLE